VPPLERLDPAVGPRAALEEVMATALARPPCLVSFSGGRDSSALLAVAVHVARREGLELPVPATLVFPGSRAADEAEWQRTVLEHLRVDEQLRIEVHTELDAVGPVAAAALRRHGLFWPFNAHFHVPIIERATGGTVVTGFGGDEIARSSSTARAERVLARRRRPSAADVLTVGLAVSPVWVKRAVHRHRARRETARLPWLTPLGARTLARAIGDDQAAIPLGWESVVRRRIWRDRYFRICRETFSVMGGHFDVSVVHPFVDERVLDALASAGGFGGLGGRSELMALLFGDLLPDQVVRRPTKGSFTDPLWTETSRRFARRWSGKGVDESLVDPGALRRHWLGDDRNLLSTTLLQQAWLHDHLDR
jgi:asparagine synthetase B (glutamine-hydrolysing)